RRGQHPAPRAPAVGGRHGRLRAGRHRTSGQRSHVVLHERPLGRGHELTMLELRGVEKRYGARRDEVVAVAPVDLVIDDDEIVAVVGPSGCGKTTLLRMLAGITAPSAGHVAIDGRPLWDGTAVARDTARDVALVFQEANLLPWLSVEANVAFPL